MMLDWISSLADGPFAQWLVDTLWATTLLLALVMMLRRPVAHYFGARIAYALWAIPFARLFMPPLTQTIEVPVADLAESAVTMPIALDSPAYGAGAGSEFASIDPAAVLMSPSTDWIAIALTVWLCGAGLFLVSQLGAYLQNRRELLEDAVPIGTHDGITVVEIAGISGPFAFGLWQRYIALPIGFDRQFDPVERELALAHECAHHRSGDLWANFAGLFLLSLHWFNPIAWLAWRAFRFDQEAACDSRVMRLSDARQRAAYARAIAKAATGRTLAFASPLNPRDKIVERLKMLGRKEHGALRRGVGNAMVGTGLTGALAMTATVTYAIQPIATPAAIEPVDLPPSAPAAPVPPAAAVAPVPPVPPTIEDGDYVYRFERNGRTVTMRLDQPMDAVQLARLEADADRGREQADRDRRQAERDREQAGRDREQADRIREQADRMREQADRIRQQADRERERADRIRARATASAGSVRTSMDGGEQTFVSVDGDVSTSMKITDCKGRKRSDAFMTQSTMKKGKTTHTKVVTCGEIIPDEATLIAQVERGLELGARHLKSARLAVQKDPNLSEEERREMLQDLDDDLADMRRDLAEAKREIRQELREARTESW